MMTHPRTLGFFATTLLALSALAQKPIPVEAQDAQRTREEFVRLLEKYPPTVRAVLSLDPALLSNKEYLEPYPGLAAYLGNRPEIARDPAFFVGTPGRDFRLPGHDQGRDEWGRLIGDIGVFIGFGMAIGLLTWLIRTLVDYRRWTRLATVQTNVHTKLLDRFTQNDELLAYIQTPAGSKFLESSPISLDPGTRSMGAPMGRILWSIQAGLVLTAAGFGLEFAASGMENGSGEPLHVLGILGVALGLGLIASSGISFIISSRMGLLGSRTNSAGVQG